MQALWFLHFARRLMLIDINIKFSENILNGFHVIERTCFCFLFCFVFCDGQSSKENN